MYWKIEALTAKRAEIVETWEGSREDVEHQAAVYGLEILGIKPDYVSTLKGLFQNNKLSSTTLSVFFKDFSDLQRCGLSVYESLSTLHDTTSNPVLREALKKINNYINDGRSLEESFENTKVFPKIVCVTVSAAEKTGRIHELLDILAQYFKFRHDNRKKILRSLVYPAVILCMLTGLSIFISLKLVPLLKSFIIPGAKKSLSAIMLIGYANFIREDWWLLLLTIFSLIYLAGCFWRNYRERFMETVFGIPLVGSLIKNIEISQIFLNMYVYQKSGINIVQTMSNVHQASKTYITEKLILIQERIFKGGALGDAFKQDPFFPEFVWQNLSKGQVSGNYAQYFERIYRYYDIKTKDAIDALIAVIEPILLALAALFLVAILCTFILPIYTSMNQMSEGIFK